MLSEVQVMAIERLREMVPGLPDDFETALDARVRDLISHSQYQILILATQQLLPDLPREAFSHETLVGDIVAWLDRYSPGAETLSSPRRGSYQSFNVTLRPIFESDVSRLYGAALQPQHAHRWRFRGRTPSPDEFASSLFSQAVLAQFMVVPISHPDRPIGHASAYDANFVARHCALAIQRLDNGDGGDGPHGLMMEGLFLLISYTFDHFNFHKLYFEVPEYNMTMLSSLQDGSILEHEGRMRCHYYYGDRFWDGHVLALYKDRWDDIARHFRPDWPSE